MDIDAELSRVGLTADQFESLLSDAQDKIDGTQDIEWSEIVAKYDLPVGPGFLRHALNSKPFGGAFVRAYFSKNRENKSYVEQMDDIRKEKQKLSDERAALRKISRESGRREQDLEYLGKLIQETQYTPVMHKTVVYHDDNDLLIMLSDIHYGLEAESNFGIYNADVAHDRMNQYLDSILKIQSIHCSENAYVFCGGDLINGNIHQTTQLQNRENIIEQVQGVSEMISEFIYQLSQHFTHVYVNGISGNHSRLNKKDLVLRDERLDSLVPWYLKAKLNNLENVIFLDDQYDSTIAAFDIRGNKIVGVHGDMDSFSESGVSKLTMMLDFKPHAVLYGHLHKCSYDDISGVRLIRSGSFCGTVDDYVISKRITGRASQMVCVVDKKGIQSLYPVTLD